ncbi:MULTISPECIES: hypothetical protein [Paenarthrobacter]|jgi:hypothetical protein|uniref:hypothetical protein n=1 Tax=Paenarthrobacter TaxID=1742992 RepID=UPI00037A928A|nr:MULTISPECIES: hypothetical protein [Paenarthrobacter]BCW12212.1 hypothetical protein NtRootA2_34940 [Arthrobacter sp. NtRootA2]BCW16294.1 hypothetical protein NtRootA4_32730 [Arthrobacter sp. NtRootA4]BCW24626.1 hypothetical protein NtRootC7_34930 [Arthrobacter sp. NtRootC7]BCW28897.1 hypothetical protein NtRootC45_34970 [Arthrobacter sp. NtRootC45]BCW33167.1 hypothetical protein NtRootD5_34980 [Arthrobacter sp. NtRootD5]BCW42017.1 hypothetical protein StoSoilB3_35520 [Arthrobacter sp. Sto
MSYQPPIDYYQQPQRQGTRGLGAGITSIVSAVLSPIAAVVSIPLGLAAIASSLSRYNPDNDAWWIGALVLAGVAVLLSIVAVISGLIAVFRAGRMNAGRITGIIGLAIMAVNVFGIAFMVFLVLGSGQGF